MNPSFGSLLRCCSLQYLQIDESLIYITGARGRGVYSKGNSFFSLSFYLAVTVDFRDSAP